jgi:hypothetical protein
MEVFMSMRTYPRSDESHLQDWINLVCALLLFISPWAFGFSDDNLAARTAWISGVVIAVMAVIALVQFHEWEEWVSAALGLWTVAAPWVLGFAIVAYAPATFVVLGAVILVASLSELWIVHHPTSMAS